MPPSGSTRGKGKGKQPKIIDVLGGSTKKKTKARRIIVDSSSDEESLALEESDDEQPTPVRKVGRPKTKEVADLFDPRNPEEEFSMYVSKAKEHIPLAWFDGICDYLEAHVNMFDGSTERGKKEENLHFQGVFAANMLPSPEMIKRFVSDIKSVVGVRWGDGSGCKVQVKKLVAGQTFVRMIGYVRKDRNMNWFRNRNLNVTAEMIAEGVAEHESLALSYIDNKTLLTKSNLFQKVWQHWVHYMSPRIAPFSEVLTEMLNAQPKKYIISATVLMNNGGQMRRAAAESYWLLAMGHDITEMEVRNIIYHPKNAFSQHEYQLPLAFCPQVAPRPSMFGESDEEEEAGPSNAAPETGADAA